MYSTRKMIRSGFPFLLSFPWAWVPQVVPRRLESPSNHYDLRNRNTADALFQADSNTQSDGTKGGFGANQQANQDGQDHYLICTRLSQTESLHEKFENLIDLSNLQSVGDNACFATRINATVVTVIEQQEDLDIVLKRLKVQTDTSNETSPNNSTSTGCPKLGNHSCVAAYAETSCGPNACAYSNLCEAIEAGFSVDQCEKLSVGVPTAQLSAPPSSGGHPSLAPSLDIASLEPSKNASATPLFTPSSSPSSNPSNSSASGQNSTLPLVPNEPSSKPSAVPSSAPSSGPSTAPSLEPSPSPSFFPSAMPSLREHDMVNVTTRQTVLLSGGAFEQEGDLADTITFFESITKRFLNNALSSNFSEVRVTSVAVARIHVSDANRLLSQGQDTGSKLRIITTIYGQHSAAHQHPFGALVKEIFNSKGDSFVELLKTNDFFHETAQVSSDDTFLPRVDHGSSDSRRHRIAIAGSIAAVCAAIIVVAALVARSKIHKRKTKVKPHGFPTADPDKVAIDGSFERATDIPPLELEGSPTDDVQQHSWKQCAKHATNLSFSKPQTNSNHDPPIAAEANEVPVGAASGGKEQSSTTCGDNINRDSYVGKKNLSSHAVRQLMDNTLSLQFSTLGGLDYLSEYSADTDSMMISKTNPKTPQCFDVDGTGSGNLSPQCSGRLSYSSASSFGGTVNGSMSYSTEPRSFSQDAEDLGDIRDGFSPPIDSRAYATSLPQKVNQAIYPESRLLPPHDDDESTEASSDYFGEYEDDENTRRNSGYLSSVSSISSFGDDYRAPVEYPESLLKPRDDDCESDASSSDDLYQFKDSIAHIV